MTATDDFGRTPWLYPGTPVDRSDPIDPVLLDPGQNGGRVLVVAVGSNASRAVMRRKFERFGIVPVVSFIRARVTGMRVAHSAHVSAPGYIPAAPVVDPAATVELVATLLDVHALAALDATEPNYVRHQLSADRFPLQLDLEKIPEPVEGHVARPRSFDIYLSRHGVLAPPGERALELLAQEHLFTRLAAECTGFARLARGVPREVIRSFAGSADLRAMSRDVFRDAGWVRSAGFDPHSAK